MNALATLPTRAPDAIAFAFEVLFEQGIPPWAARSCASALGLLLERSKEPGPVFLSGNEGARLAGIDPRTWWLVKKRLLSLGHLVASSGGEPPRGRPGGRGRKAAYSVSPRTLERFRESQSLPHPEETLMASVMPSVFSRPSSEFPHLGREALSDHRSLRTLKYEKTLDVLRVLEGRGDDGCFQSLAPAGNSEKPPDPARCCEINTEKGPVNTPSRKPLAGNSEKPQASSGEIARLLFRERKASVRLELVRVLERALVLEAFSRTENPEERAGLLEALRVKRRKSTASASASLSPLAGGCPPAFPLPSASLSPLAGGCPPAFPLSRAGDPSSESRGRSPLAGTGAGPRPLRARRKRSRKPLWSPEEGEAREVLLRVRSVLEWANRDFGASFDVERSSRDTLLYPYEVVRAALANVLIKKKKGYPFENPGAVLWEGISLEDYRKEEFSVASLDEVLRLTEEQDPEPVPKNEELPRREARPPASEGERRRAEASLEVFESLPKDVREDIERRAEALAREGLVSRGLPFEQAILSLRKLSCQKEILEREHASELAARLSSHDSHFWKIEPECLQSPEARDAPIKA